MNKELHDGEHREYYEDRSLKSIYNIKNGKRHGRYIEYRKNSDTVALTEEYLEGELHGKREGYGVSGTETYEHGILIERRWDDSHYEIYKDGKLSYVFEKDHWGNINIDMHYKDGEEYNGTHYSVRRVGGRDGYDYTTKYTKKDGKYHGEYIDGYADVRANYDMGVLHGQYYEILTDGSIKEGEYNQGQFNGTIRSKDGKTVETWVDGNIDLVTQYKADRWGRDIRVVSEIRPNGTCIEYENGKIVKKYEQKNGKKDGPYEEFDPKGWIRTEARYLEGELNGFYKEYNSDGTIASKRFYKQGRDISIQREILVEAAKKHVHATEKVAPKQSKLQKAILAMKMKAPYSKE